MSNRANVIKHKAAQTYGHELTERIIALGGRCMEQVIDREHAIYAERWLFPNGVGVIAYYSPKYREVFIQSTREISWTATDAALAKAAQP